jgi:microcystin-dependent protein/predicted nuclease with TOPRIM domain
MSSNQISTLTSGTINGLNSLNLDELNTTTLNAGTMDGELFYIDRIEANEIIVDTNLQLTNTGVISVGNVEISDIELTYLNGVSSNIQTQIDNVNSVNSGLVSTVNDHTTQIASLELDVGNLQTNDALQDADILDLQTTTQNLQSNDVAQDASILDLQTTTQNLQSNDVLQDASILDLQTTTQNLQSNDVLQDGYILDLQSKTSNITSANATSTNTNKPIYSTAQEGLRITNGNNKFISGHTTTLNAREFVIGQRDVGSGLLVFQNETLGGEVSIVTGDNGSGGGLGGSKINLYSNGNRMYRTNFQGQFLLGEIGASNGNDYNLYIKNGTGVNSIANNINIVNVGGLINIDVDGDKFVDITSNVIYVGNSNVAAAGNGRHSNILFRNANNTGWETQSSAYTEADKASIYNNMLPVGSVIAFGGVFAPTGYLLCDGSFYSQTAYPALFAVISTYFSSGRTVQPPAGQFAVPDLRQNYISGVGTQSNHSHDIAYGVNRNVGSFSKSSIQNHRHTIIVHDGTVGIAQGNLSNNNIGNDADTLKTTEAGVKNDDLTTMSENKTQPSNVAMNFIIKY